MKSSWFALLFCLIIISACGKDDLCVEREILRISSPDKLVDAVVSKSDCGATTSYSYRIYLVKSGGEPVEGEAIFLADHVEDMRASWLAAKKLVISYEEARIFEFRNFWHSNEIDSFRYVVSVTELKRSEHSPCLAQ